jgi:hypothetical protein
MGGSSMSDDLDLPAFLDRKLNGVTSGDPRGKRRADRNGIVWPKKKNWRKIELKRRKAEKAIFKGYTFTQRKGQ